MTDVDATDLAILRVLATDATRSAADVGRAVGIGQPAAWRRIKRLTDQGVIAGRRVVLDQAALGFGVTVFLGIKLAAKGRTGLEDFERAVTAIPEVQVVQHVLRTWRVGGDQHAQVGQGVEQHVRLQLRLQEREARLRRVALGLRGLQRQLLRLRPAVEEKRDGRRR